MNEETLFALALEKSATERAAFLDEACSQDAALRHRVAALLESHQHSQFLGTPALHLAADVLRVGETTGARQLDPADADEIDSSLDFLAPSDKSGSLGRLAHYDIQAIIGRGGMGIVLRAFDERLHRVVAIKVLAAQLATSATARKRFTREAQAVAAVSHEHVVTIHAVEEASGRPYIVMHYVAGLSLDQRLHRNGPLELQEILRIGMQTAMGLVAAHAQGLVHRDIKPANILLENGVERVKITDFGLARAAADASLTQSGAVAGTPHYMAPEQARGDVLDARTDLFSLGSVLYAMCTGHSPFRAGNTMAVLKRVCEDTPTPIRQTNPEIPKWLVSIIDKLHAKNPADRFQSAAEVADLLSRHLAHVQHPSIAPLSALPVRAESRAVGGSLAQPAKLTLTRWRWAVAAAVLLFCLLGGFSLTEATGVTELASTVIRILTPEGTLLVEVDDPEVKVTIEGDGGLVITGAGPQEVRVRPGSYQVHATKDGKPVPLDRDLVMITRGERKVVKVSLVPGEADLSADVKRPFSLAATPVRRFEGHCGEIRSMALSPDGRRILSGGDDKTVRLWDVETGREIRQFPSGHQIATGVFSAKGDHALTCRWENEGTAQLWDVESGKELRRFSHGNLAMLGGALSLDGSHALTSGHDNTLRLWDVESGNELRRFDYNDPVAIRSIAFSPDGRFAVTGALDATPSSAVRLWKVETGKEVRRFRGHSGWIASVVYSTDGERVLSASWDNSLRLWDVASGRELLRMEHADKVDAAAISLDGHRAVSGCLDGSVHLWDLETGKQLLQFQAHEGAVKAVALHPNGRDFISAGGDASIRQWTVPDPGIQKASTSTPGAFVLLGDDIAERKFDTLEEAVLHASDGDTIDIRGNGPFLSEPIRIQDTGLTIRAGDGFRPVIKLGSQWHAGDKNLILTNAFLVLEGMEIHGAVPAKPAAIHATQALWAVNCRFRSPISTDNGAECVLKNCEVIGNGGIGGNYGRGARFTFENCLFCTNWAALAPNDVAAVQDILFKINCTAFVCKGGFVSLSRRSPLAISSDHEPAESPLRFEVEGSIFDVGWVVGFGQAQSLLKSTAGLEPDEDETMLRQLVGWRGERNLFAPRQNLVTWWIDSQKQPPRGPIGLKQWKQFWQSPETDSAEALVRFEGGNLASRPNAVFDQLTAEDFRLRPDSAGYRAGPDGKDLGADVDLVGPGAAYERWKKTPEYQEWITETGQQE